MAAPLSADAFLRALRDEGLKVIEVGSWRTHNRNHKGAWGPVHGVMLHHTVTSGTAASVRICRDGYSGLPGPLCHGVIDKAGTVHLVGYGRANHAGLGDDDVLRAVIAERTLPPDNEANTDGNARFYGFECINLGDGTDPWPAAQVEAMARASAALCRVHGWGAGSVIGHAEWQPGKKDPCGPGQSAAVMMRAIRDRVAELLADDQPAPTPPTQGEKDTDMQLTDHVKLGDWVTQQWPRDKGLADKTISINTALGSGYAYARRAAEASEETARRLAGLEAAVRDLAAAVRGGGAR